MRILYFDIDSLRPDHLGCYGYDRPTSPTIDRIASEGMRFNHYYCASSPCVPSRACLVSSRYGTHHRVVSNYGDGAQFRIDVKNYGGAQDDQQLFPRQLMEHGIDTISFSTFPSRHFALWFFYGWTEFHTPTATGGTESAEEINTKVLRWLQKNADRDNYFLHINYWDVHRPYFMDASWADRFAGHPVTQPWPDEEAIATHQKIRGPYTAHGQFPDDESPYALIPGAINNRADFEDMVTGYDAAIAYTDHHIAQVLAELEHQGNLKDTAIIISADHGDAFGEHGIYSDHVNVDECIHRIPLIIRWPGVTPAGGVSDAFMANVDFAPTICDLLEIPIPTRWDGKSYRANVEGDAGEDRDFLVWDSGLYTVQRGLRTKSHLYIRTYDAQGYGNWPEESLYDLQEDPYETQNLATSEPELLANCRETMQAWLNQELHGDDPLQAVLAERQVRQERVRAKTEWIDFPEYEDDAELAAQIDALRASARREFTSYLTPTDRIDEVSNDQLLDFVLKIDCYNRRYDTTAADYALRVLSERLGGQSQAQIQRRLQEAHEIVLRELMSVQS